MPRNGTQMSIDNPWTQARLDRLRRLWLEGILSVAEIGAQLGVSKSAAQHKARSLGLPGKPPPVMRGGYKVGFTPDRSKRVEGSTLPPLPSELKQDEI